VSQSNEVSTWRKSSLSGGGSGDCVEVAVVTGQEQIKR
jgi:Domain of unknown function (DUF397)